MTRAHEKGPTVAEEQVTSPDQHKPINRKGWYIAGVISSLALLGMLIGNHEGWVEDAYLIVIAALILAAVAGDVTLRRIGLRR